MISRLSITDKKISPLKWWETVPFCDARDEWEFDPGLNIVWGPNGSGKSTLILTIARLLHCEQGSVSKITQTSIRNLWTTANEFRNGATVISDGKAARYVKPDKLVGTSGGSFDDDFFDAGFKNMGRRLVSAGQLTALQLNDIPRFEEPGFEPSDVVDSVGNMVNDLWIKAKEETTKSLKAQIPVGKTTLLIDEPDMHLDIPAQARLWGEVIPRLTKAYQVIVATHSPWAANVPGAFYIETASGYLEKCRTTIRTLHGS